MCSQRPVLFHSNGSGLCTEKFGLLLGNGHADAAASHSGLYTSVLGCITMGLSKVTTHKHHYDYGTAIGRKYYK